MGIFDKFFGGAEEKKVMRLDIAKTPPTPKEAYELRKLEREWDAEYDAMDDDWRIEKSIERHQKKSQKRR